MNKHSLIVNLISGILGGIIVMGFVAFSDTSPEHVSGKIYNQNKNEMYNRTLNNDSNADNRFNATAVGNYSPLKQFEYAMVTAASSTVDAVVHVKTAYVRQYTYGNPFLDYFYGNSPRSAQPVVSSGSGVIISEEGYIVTNNHVIENAQQIKVILNDKREFDAELVGTDPGTDIALLKVDEEGLPHLKPGNSDDVQVGEWVLAVGNPFNLTSTVTAGIVSAKARNINLLRENYGIEAFIQTDAAVNPGNSGGALVNRKGELIGINTAIASKTGSFSGYSFAVPVNIAMKVVEDIIEYGEVQRAVMGVVIHDLNEAFAKENNIETLEGVYIDKIAEGGAADNAGIEPGDVILQIGSVKVDNVAQLQEQLSKFRPGDKLSVTVLRNNEKIQKQINLQNKEGSTKIIKGKDPVELLGAKLDPVSEKEKRMLKVSHGMKIVALKSGKLKNAGVHEGFIILSMNNTKIKGIDDIRSVLKHADGGIMVEGIYPNGMKAYYAFGI